MACGGKKTWNGSPNPRTWVAVATGRCGILALALSDQAAEATCPAPLISGLTLEDELNFSALYSSWRNWEQRWTDGPYLVRTSHHLGSIQNCSRQPSSSITKQMLDHHRGSPEVNSDNDHISHSPWCLLGRHFCWCLLGRPFCFTEILVQY